MEKNGDSIDHFNGGPMLLGRIPSGMLNFLEAVFSINLAVHIDFIQQDYITFVPLTFC